MIVAVNKMDLVGYAEERFDDVVREVLDARRRSSACTTSSSSRSARCTATTSSSAPRTMPWYAGPPLLERLETIPVEPPAVHGARLPVQLVLRGEGGDALGRRAARRGRAAAPATRSSCCRAARARASPRSRDADGAAEEVEAPLSVSIRLEDEVDLARGELIAAAEDAPDARARADADALLAGRPPAARARPLPAQARHPHRPGAARRDRRPDRVRDARRGPPPSELRAQRHRAASGCGSAARSPPTPTPQCHATGAFILIDEATNDTVGGGDGHR